MRDLAKLVPVMCVLVACGGSDASIDGGGGDSASGMDAMMTTDTGGGNDTGTNDTGTNDAGGGDAASDAGSFNVGSVSCVVLWLDAAHNITQNNNVVSAWGDRSSSMNNAAQNIANRQPSLVSNAINNLPAIHFNKGGNNGQMLVIPDSMSLRWGTGDFAVWTVARFDNNPNDQVNSTRNGTLYSKVAFNQNPNVGPLLLANNPIQAGAGLAGVITAPGNVLGASMPYNDNKARSYGFRRFGSTVELRVNGAQVASIQQNGSIDVSNQGLGVRIGADGDASINRLNGDIAEVIGCKGMIAAQDMTSIEAYLQSKYNL